MTKRDKYLRKAHGITEAAYRTMLKMGNGGCWICGGKPKPGKNLHVDHCHRTQRRRGLLCFRCNRRLLGRGREDPELHEKAAVYLRNVTFDGRSLV